MARFIMNRRWTFILALGVSLACCFAAHSRAVAVENPGSSGGGVIGDPGDPGLVPPPAGDPDLPSGPGKSTRPGRLTRGGTDTGRLAVGDSRPVRIVWMWRLRVVLQGARGWYFRI